MAKTKAEKQAAQAALHAAGSGHTTPVDHTTVSPNAQARLNARNPAYVQAKLAEFEALSDGDKAKFLQANFYLRTPFRDAGVDLNFYLAGNFPLG